MSPIPTAARSASSAPSSRTAGWWRWRCASKLENQRISEIETLVVRDAAAAKAVDAMEPQPSFLEAVPAAERPTRQS